MKPVTDPKLLAELDGSTAQPVSDSALLAQLDSANERQPIAEQQKLSNYTSMSPLAGPVAIGENALSVISGAYKPFAHALAIPIGAIGGMIDPRPNSLLDNMTDAQNFVSEMPQYQPRTLPGQAMQASMSKPFEAWKRFVDKRVEAGDVGAAGGAALVAMPDVALTLAGAKVAKNQQPLSQKTVNRDSLLRRSLDNVNPFGGLKKSQRLAGRFLRDKSGSPIDNKALLDALRGAKRNVKDSSPSAGQILHDVPEGANIVALEEALRRDANARGTRSPATTFKQLDVEQAKAIEAAKKERDASTAPLREAAFKSSGKLDSKPLIDNIDKMIKDPNNRAKPVQDQLLFFKSALEKETTAQGAYAQRKFINDILEGLTESDRVTKRHASSQLIELKKHIDDAIVQSGAEGWRTYLDKYAEKSKAIDAELERIESARAEGRKYSSNIDLGNDPGGARLPSMVNREVTAINALEAMAKKRRGPEIKSEMARFLVDPQGRLVRELSPQLKQRALAEALRKGVTIGAPSQINQRKR